MDELNADIFTNIDYLQNISRFLAADFSPNQNNNSDYPLSVSGAGLKTLKNKFETLQQKISLLSRLIDSSHEGFFAIYSSGSLACFNKRLSALFGLTIKELEQKDADELIAIIASFLKNSEQFLSDTQSFLTHEHVDAVRLIALNDGKILKYSVKSHVLDDQTRGLVFQFTDIKADKFLDNNFIPIFSLTDAKKNDQYPGASWSTERLFVSTCLAAITDAVIISDPTGLVNYLNEAAIKLTGWSAKDALGKSIDEVFRTVNENNGENLLNPVISVFKATKNEVYNDDKLLISKDGIRYYIKEMLTPIYVNDTQLLGSVLVFQNVTEKYQLMKDVYWQAGHDLLTSLPNRSLLADRFERALFNAQRQQRLLGVSKIDLDDFKPINDLYGHAIGDQLLVAVANRMGGIIRGEDTLARIGGDEFALLIGNLSDVYAIQGFLERLLATISAPYVIDGKTISISASIGISIYPLDKSDADTLLRHADQAMYQAKQAGRNRIAVFDVEQDQFTQNSYFIRQRVKQALLTNEFCLYYQPKVNMRTGEIIGMEALLRWKHPEQGLVQPMDFLPLVEQSDVIIDIGEWVLDQSLQQMATWFDIGHPMPVSVNISARHFQHPEFLSHLSASLAQFPTIPPQFLEIEILESVALADIEQMRQLICDCKALGVTFSFDDFGTGYSSLSYLKRLPADILKMDQSFVRGMLDDKDDLALIEAVISLAVVFNREVIAEGVETIEHGLLLMKLGCDMAQGFGIAHPIPANMVMPWVKQFQPDPRWALWANVQWELDDFPLLVAQYDHYKWYHQLSKVVNDKPSFVFALESIDHHQCRFGDWYQGPGTLRYKDLPEFLAIGPTHIKIHQLGKEVISLCWAGEFDAARKLCQKLLVFNDEMMAQLVLLQFKVANATHLASSVLGQLKVLNHFA